MPPQAKSTTTTDTVPVTVERFYGPEQPLFDKTWVLPDIAQI